MFKDRMFKGRGAGRGGPGRMVPPSRPVAPIGQRNPRGGSILPPSRGLNGNGGGGGNGNGKATPPPPLPAGVGTEENFTLKPGRGLPFAMIIKLVPGLVEDVQRAQAQGSKVQIKFGPQANNSSGNIIDVGGKEFRFAWAQEPGDLCDIYEEQQSGEDGNGVLVESGSSWRKLTVQRTLNESARDRVKMSSAEAERQQKSRKAIILDHGNPVVKNQTKPVVNTLNDSNARKLQLKNKKEPPPKKRKIEGSSAAAAVASDAVAKPAATQPILSAAENIKSANSPVPSPSEQLVTLPQPTLMQKPARGHSSKGLSITDGAVTHQHSSKRDVDKRKDKAPEMASTPTSEAGNQKSASELRNLLITQLTENPKGSTIKAIEKAIGFPGKKIEPVIKTIATYQAPGRYILKPGVEKESSTRLSPGNRSSPESQPTESPIVDSSPMSEKVGQPTDEQQMHNSPAQDSYVNIVDEIHEHLHESPGPAANQKNTINSDGSGSSSSSDSGSGSESDTGSSDSGSDSGSSSDTESEASSSSNEGSDEHVDIMSDDDKPTNEEEIQQKLKDSKPSPSQVDGDGSGESYEQKCMVKEKDDDKLPISPRDSEDVEICDDIGEGEGEGEAISSIAKHYAGNLTSDGDDDTEMAIDVDVINCEGEVKTPEEKTNIFTKNGKQGNNHSPDNTGGYFHPPEDKKIESKDNRIEESLQKTERMHKSVPKQGYGRNQGQNGSDKDRYNQESRAQIEKKEEPSDPDIKRNRDLASSQSRFESPARPQISPSIKDFEARQLSKEISKSRFTDTISERSMENATHLGRSGGQSSAAAQISLTKDSDDERLDQYSDGQQPYQRYSDPESRSKALDVMHRSGRSQDIKIPKPHSRASRIASESDVSAAKSSILEEKKSKHEATFRTVSEEFDLTKDKINNSSKISKETENAEKYSRMSESQCKRAGDQSEWQSRDVGPSGQLSMVNAQKDTKKTEFDKYQLHSGRESVLKREYSDLELGEFREPLSEEEPQELKARLSKIQGGRGPIDTKVKNVGKRGSASPNITKGRSIGKEAPELKKPSTSEPIDDFSKLDGRTVVPNLARPYKKSRKSPPSEHSDLDPLTRPEKMTGMPLKAANGEITKTSPRQGVEVQSTTTYRKSPTNILQKSEYKGRVQEATSLESNEDKGITKIDEKRKENTKIDNNQVPVRKKSSSSDEDQPFYAKYEKSKADLRGPIKNISQYSEYTQEFKEKYSCYRRLNTSLDSDKEDFQKLGRELQSAKDRGDTQSFATISEEVKKIFSQCVSRHKRMKKVFIVLHEELENLKQRLNEFLERYEQQL